VKQINAFKQLKFFNAVYSHEFVKPKKGTWQIGGPHIILVKKYSVKTRSVRILA
jgi:hypothetical protein